MTRKAAQSTDRVVLVDSGFGVWEGGRHRASARWTDVVRVRVMTGTGMRLELRLRDGTDVIVPEALPGFESFLVAAEARLVGMQPLGEWWGPATQPGAAASERLIFTRRTLG